jgi:hypothetical protein
VQQPLADCARLSGDRRLENYVVIRVSPEQ